MKSHIKTLLVLTSSCFALSILTGCFSYSESSSLNQSDYDVLYICEHAIQNYYSNQSLSSDDVTIVEYYKKNNLGSVRLAVNTYYGNDSLYLDTYFYSEDYYYSTFSYDTPNCSGNTSEISCLYSQEGDLIGGLAQAKTIFDKNVKEGSKVDDTTIQALNEALKRNVDNNSQSYSNYNYNSEDIYHPQNPNPLLNDFKFVIHEDEAYVKAYVGVRRKKVEVPAFVDNYPVTKILENAFGNHTWHCDDKEVQIKEISLPDSITEIENGSLPDTLNYLILPPQIVPYSDAHFFEGYNYAGYSSQIPIFVLRKYFTYQTDNYYYSYSPVFWVENKNDIIIDGDFLLIKTTSDEAMAIKYLGNGTKIELPASIYTNNQKLYVTEISRSLVPYGREKTYQLVLTENIKKVPDLDNSSYLATTEYGRFKYIGTKTNPYYCVVGTNYYSEGSFFFHSDTQICAKYLSSSYFDSANYINGLYYLGCPNNNEFALIGIDKTYNFESSDVYLSSDTKLILLNSDYDYLRNDIHINCSSSNIRHLSVPSSFTPRIYISGSGRYTGGSYIVDNHYKELILFQTTGPTTLPSGIKRVASNAVRGEITSIVVPDSVEYIENSAFYNAYTDSFHSKLTVTFGTSLKCFDDIFNYYCEPTIIVKAGNPYYSVQNDALVSKDGSILYMFLAPSNPNKKIYTFSSSLNYIPDIYYDSPYDAMIVPESVLYFGFRDSDYYNEYKPILFKGHPIIPDNYSHSEYHFERFEVDGDFIYIENPNNTATLLKYVGSDKYVTIPNYAFTDHPINTIGIGAFRYKEIENVQFPKFIQKIDDNAFEGCPLKSLNLPNTIEYLGSIVFSCEYIEKLVIPASITFIASSCFYYYNSHYSSQQKIYNIFLSVDTVPTKWSGEWYKITDGYYSTYITVNVYMNSEWAYIDGEPYAL